MRSSEMTDEEMAEKYAKGVEGVNAEQLLKEE